MDCVGPGQVFDAQGQVIRMLVLVLTFIYLTFSDIHYLALC